jgi:hypothetical protein
LKIPIRGDNLPTPTILAYPSFASERPPMRGGFRGLKPA